MSKETLVGKTVTLTCTDGTVHTGTVTAEAPKALWIDVFLLDGTVYPGAVHVDRLTDLQVHA